MTVLLATGTAAAQSADFTLSATDGASTLFLVSTGALPGGANCEIQYKGANGVYYPFAALTTGQPTAVISSPGTFRVARPAGVDVGVDRA